MFDHFRGKETVVQEYKGHTDREYGEFFAKIGGKLRNWQSGKRKNLKLVVND